MQEASASAFATKSRNIGLDNEVAGIGRNMISSKPRQLFNPNADEEAKRSTGDDLVFGKSNDGDD